MVIWSTMKIQVLGAHNSETLNSKYISLLIDEILVIDTGGLTSSLSLEAQKNIKAVLLTHKHFDHIKDVPSLAINLFFQDSATTLYSTGDTHRALMDNLLNDIIYPNFFKIPETNPTLKYHQVEAGKMAQIEGYRVLPVQMNHEEITVGYQITAQDNKAVFYSADTGKGLARCWQQISPQLLLIEVTLPNSHAGFAAKSNHLTPELLQNELASFHKIKGYLPPVVALHMTPDLEKEIEAELAAVSRSLDISITVAHEGMLIQI
jgi:ribonuclease BN (tRNA processing enzyme)